MWIGLYRAGSQIHMDDEVLMGGQKKVDQKEVDQMGLAWLLEEVRLKENLTGGGHLKGGRLVEVIQMEYDWRSLEGVQPRGDSRSRESRMSPRSSIR